MSYFMEGTSYPNGPAVEEAAEWHLRGKGDGSSVYINDTDEKNIVLASLYKCVFKLTLVD
jgi:hypothetical protein